MFGKTVQNNRNKQGLTQQELAVCSMTTRANIAKIESGTYIPSMYLALRIIEALNMPESKIMRRLIYGKSHGH